MNLKVLDAGCGSGWYAEYLLKRGATVTAFDVNTDFVTLTQARVGGRAHVLQADLAEPLQFAGDSEFDVVVCPLVMHYIKDWPPIFGEFHRILKPSGILIFSTHHPFMDWKHFNKEDYFAIELVEVEWNSGKITFYRPPLTTISQDLEATGFFIERLLEPQPTEDFRRVHPEGYERLTKNPWFLMIRARKKA
jgi:SAM-dependent methyltransferase